jgi:hypothetical protein
VRLMSDAPAGGAVSDPETDASAVPWIQRVPWWRRGLAVAAAVIAVLAAIWLIKGGPGGGVGILFTFLAGIPAFAKPRSFGRVCLAFAVVLFAIGVLGAVLALFVYLPVAVMLLLAWLADPGARPRLAPLIAVTDAAVYVLMAGVLSMAILS